MGQMMFMKMVINFPGHGRFFPRSFGARISDVGTLTLTFAGVPLVGGVVICVSWGRAETVVGGSFYDGGTRGCALPDRVVVKAQPSQTPILGRLHLPEILFWEGCTFPKSYFRKAVPVPSRNPFLGRLYLSETIFREGCTFPRS